MKDFHINSAATNTHLLTVLHAVASDADLIGFLYHTEVFRVIQRLRQPRFAHNDNYAQLHAFAKFVAANFTRALANNRRLPLELLFDKTKTDAFDIAHGYNATKEQKQSVKVLWTEALEDEVCRRRLCSLF